MMRKTEKSRIRERFNWRLGEFNNQKHLTTMYPRHSPPWGHVERGIMVCKRQIGRGSHRWLHKKNRTRVSRISRRGAFFWGRVIFNEYGRKGRRTKLKLILRQQTQPPYSGKIALLSCKVFI